MVVISDVDVLGLKLGVYHRRMAESVNRFQKGVFYEELRQRANTFLDDGNLFSARCSYIHALYLTENSQSWPYIGLGVIALKLNDLDEAEMAFVVANQSEGNSVEAYCGLARVYQLRGWFRDAVSVYCKALEIEPDNLIAITGLVRQCRQIGEFGTIIHCLKRYLKRHPDDIEMLLCLACFYGKDNQPKLAMVLAERVLELEPENGDAVSILNWV